MKALFKNEILNMVFVLGCICVCAALALSGVYEITKGPIAETLLKQVKGPAVKSVFKGYKYDNKPMDELIKIPVGKDKTGKPAFLLVFPAKQGGKTVAVAMESKAAGFGGDVKIMVGVDIAKSKYTGIAVVGHSETPGYGARIDTDEKFVPSFAGKGMDKDLTKDDVDALTGASVTTGATLEAVNKVRALVAQYKDQMVK
jgi:electron transport complex protein RnfG